MSDMTRIPRNASKKLAAIASADLKAVKYDRANFDDLRVTALTPAEAIAAIVSGKHDFYRLADGSYAAYRGHDVVFRLFPEGHEQQARAEALEAAAVRAELKREVPAVLGGFDALFRDTSPLSLKA